MYTAITEIAADNGNWDGPPDFWPIFPVLWFLIIVGGITAAVMISRRNSRSAGRRAGEARLAERFAAGEIDEAEYNDRLDTLRRR